MATIKEKLNGVSREAFKLYLETKDLCNPKKDRVLSQEELQLVMQRNNNVELVEALGLKPQSILRFQGRVDRSEHAFNKKLQKLNLLKRKTKSEAQKTWEKALKARILKAEMATLKKEEYLAKRNGTLAYFNKMKELQIKGMKERGLIS